VDRAVTERNDEGVVDAAMLLEKRKAVEVPADDRHLEVVAGARAILDFELERVGERLVEEPSQGFRLHPAMLVMRGYPADMRFLRAVLLFKLGFWAGMLASAALMKRVFPPRGDAESDEVALVAILNGVELESRAQAFRGGSLLSWLGGIAVDLRKAELAPDAHLDVRSLMGGIAIRVPPGWRIESGVKTLGGGVAIGVPEPESDDAPTLRLDGFTAFGGVAVGAKPAG
jgi:hypothetical protein